MTDPDRLAVAAHLHNALRRRLSRVTDVEWMARDDTYARAIVSLALADPQQADLVALGLRLQALLPSPTTVPASLPRVAVPAARYVGSLR